MAEQIESVGVDKNGLIIDKEGRATTFSTVETEDRYVNKTTGKTWSVDIPPVTPAGVGDYFFYIKNNGQETIAITDFRMVGDGITLIDIDKVSGTPAFVTGTDIIPLSRNTGKQPTIDATIKYDTDITGLVDEGRWFPLQIPSAASQEKLSTSSNIILSPGGALALKSSLVVAIEGTVSISIITI